MPVTRNEELAEVIRLACLTEHRSNVEQRALMALAWDCDRANNKNTATNRARQSPTWRPFDLVSLVDQTRVLEDDDKPVPLPKNWEKQWNTWRANA